MGALYCPSNPRVNEWFALLYQTVVAQYGIDGLDLSHARFNHPALFEGLWVCSCPHCVRAGGELGYDVAALARAVRAFVDGMRTWTPQRVLPVIDGDLAPLEQARTLGISPGLGQWFQFRADLVTRGLSRLKQSVKETANRPVVFLSDVHVPSFALLAGHSYPEWGQTSDCLSPLLSHMGSHYLENFAALAEHICARSDGLDEAVSLRLLYHLFGYTRFGLPTGIRELGVHDAGLMNHEPAPFPQLHDIVAHELQQARVLAPPELPSYPVLMGTVWPTAVIHQVVSHAEAMGHNGVIWQGTSAYTDHNLPIW
jgi:hypothetical protein